MAKRAMVLEVRPLRDGELDTVSRIWHDSKKEAYPYLPLEQGLTLEDNRRIFHQMIVPRNDIWVALDGEEIAGFLAINGSYVDRLYVHPSRYRQGVGSALLAKAKELSPGGLELHTHRENVRACAFYEQQGFTAVKYGISPPPESAPDVEYHWRPSPN